MDAGDERTGSRADRWISSVVSELALAGNVLRSGRFMRASRSWKTMSGVRYRRPWLRVISIAGRAS